MNESWGNHLYRHGSRLLTLARRRETRLSSPWPFDMRSISIIGLPLDKMSHSLRKHSSCKNANNLCWVTGIQTEVAALNTIPGGSPGSLMLFLAIIFTSSLILPTTSLSHFCNVEVQIPEQKLSTIRWDSFSILLLPCGDIPVWIRHVRTRTKMDYTKIE